MSKRVIRYEGEGRARRPVYEDEGPASAAVDGIASLGRLSALHVAGVDGPSGGAGPVERRLLTEAERDARAAETRPALGSAEHLQQSRMNGARRHVEVITGRNPAPPKEEAPMALPELPEHAPGDNPYTTLILAAEVARHAADEENGARVALRAAVDAAKLARAALAAAWMIVTTTEDLEALTTAGPLQGIERAAAEAIGKPVTVELDPTPVVRLPAKPRRPMPGSTKAEQAREKAERAERVMAAMGRLGDDQRAVAAELGMRTNAVAMVVKHARVRAAQAGAAAT